MVLWHFGAVKSKNIALDQETKKFICLVVSFSLRKFRNFCHLCVFLTGIKRFQQFCYTRQVASLKLGKYLDIIVTFAYFLRGSNVTAVLLYKAVGIT
jgi:hypothetical protein